MDDKMMRGTVNTRLTVALLCLSISLCLIQATAGACTVKLDPAAQAVTAGGAVRVAVVVEDVVGLAAYQVTLQFAPQAMSALEVAEGGFLKSGGTTLGAGLERIANDAGTVTCFYSLTARGATVSGSGTLATITFITNTTASGTFELRLHELLLADGTGTPLPLGAVANGTCTVTRPDVTAPTASPAPGPGSDGGSGQTGAEPTTIASPSASTAGEPFPSTLPGTPPATGAGGTITPATGAYPESAPVPAADEEPAAGITGFTASAATGCFGLVVAVAYLLRRRTGK